MDNNKLIRVGTGMTLTNRQRRRALNLAEEMLDCMLDETGVPYSTIISGGRAADRNVALLQLLTRCMGSGFPIFVIHPGNQALQNSIINQQASVYFPRSGEYGVFNLIGDLKPGLIASACAETGQKLLNSGRDIKNAIRFGIDLMQSAGETCSLQKLFEFPWADSGSYIQEHSRSLDALKAMNRLGAVSDGMNDADALFSALSEETFQIRCDGLRVVNLKEIMERNAIVGIDIRSDANRLTLELVLTILEKLRAKDYSFMTVIDSIPMYPNSSLLSLLSNRDRRTPSVFLTSDCTAVMGMGERERHNIMSGELNLILFAHRNGESAELLSRHFSEHNDFQTTVTTGSSKENISLIRSTRSENRAVAETRRRDIQPEEIAGLRQGNALVFPFGAERRYMSFQFT